MFWPLMLAIFRLYMNLLSSYTACVGCILGSGEGVILCGTEISCVSGGCMVWNIIISYPLFNFIYV